MKIIEEIYIKKFRGLEDVKIKFNKPVNAIIGKNGSMKTTLLGMLAHPFTLKKGAMSSEQPLIGGKEFNSPMSDKFKFVIYRVKSIQLFALLFYDEGDWPTKFQIGTPRPGENVLASLHYSAFDSASWDIAPV